MIFTYSAQIGSGPVRRGEVDASCAAEARRLAALRYADLPGEVVISRLFSPPPRHGFRVFEARDRRRINFRLPRA